MNQYIVAGTGTNVGKTIVSAILTEKLGADYWKPVQAGSIENTDTDVVRELVSNPCSVFHPESYRLLLAASPHKAAAEEGLEIEFHNLKLPVTTRPLVVETAGGLMSPLNQYFLNIHLVKSWALPVVLVSENYLGSINHTLLAAETLKRTEVEVSGIVFNGVPDASTENYILKYTRFPFIGRVNRETAINRETILHYAREFSLS